MDVPWDFYLGNILLDPPEITDNGIDREIYLDTFGNEAIEMIFQSVDSILFKKKVKMHSESVG